ncbi:MAG: Gfo/Idh/MocA family oxidoreductase [Clostridia bacterium]|nr:Gfo/Idh/MocA family oxidoreductase [Clostridia bacterium]
MKYAIIGYGNRGSLYSELFSVDKRAELTAVCDLKPVRLEHVQKNYSLPAERCWLSDDEFFKQGKLADLLVISTPDAAHYRHAIAALNLGYDLLLEKPIADSLARCNEIYELAKKLGRKVFICHVLRYAPFYTLIKKELESGKYGELITANVTENVAYWHYAHSYVRGNWADTTKSTPMILAKCCHDLDIISWLFGGKQCESVSSYGSLSFFNRAHAPANSADYCFECPLKETCAYSCLRFYPKKDNHWWLAGLDWCDPNGTDDDFRKALENKDCPYTRCVFKCDNNAVDHQVVNLLFENGATAHLTMTAFSDKCYRELHLHCTNGDIYGDMLKNLVTLNVFGGESRTVDVTQLTDTAYGHGGGDGRLVLDVISVYEGGECKGLTSIEESFASHCIGYAAEESRLQNGAAKQVTRLK